MAGQVVQNAAKILLYVCSGVEVKVVQGQLDKANLNELGSVFVRHVKLHVCRVRRQNLDLVLLSQVRINSQVLHCAKRVPTTLTVPNVCNGLHADALLLIAGLLSIDEKINGSLP